MSVPNNSNVYLPGVITIPSTLEITDITQTRVMKVVVEADPVTASIVYHPKQMVRFFIPFEYGMQQLHGKIGKILSIDGMDDTEFYFDIDSRNFDPFAIPAGNVTPAVFSPYGSNNLQFNNTTNRVPFQSLNDEGN